MKTIHLVGWFALAVLLIILLGFVVPALLSARDTLAVIVAFAIVALLLFTAVLTVQRHLRKSLPPKEPQP